MIAQITLILLSLLSACSARRLNEAQPSGATNFKMAWPECFESQMSVEECADLIQIQVEASYYDSLNIEVVEELPRDPSANFPYDSEEDNSMLHRFDIHTNYLGQVIGYSVDGQVHAATAEGENVQLNCKGMTVNECTEAVKSDLNQEGTNTVPWVKQHDPIPYVSGGEIRFCTWIFDDENNEFVAIDTKPEELEKHDELVKVNAAELSNDIMAILEDGTTITNEEAQSILASCHLHLRSRQGAEGICTDLDVAISEYSQDDIPLTSEMVTLLDDLLQQIEEFTTMPFEIKSTIQILSADEFGLSVAAIPKLGQAPGMIDCIPGTTR